MSIIAEGANDEPLTGRQEISVEDEPSGCKEILSARLKLLERDIYKLLKENKFEEQS